MCLQLPNHYKVTFVFVFTIIVITQSVSAQVVNTATMDTTDFLYQGKVKVEAYIDLYYLFNFNLPQNNSRSYAVSHHKHNELNINLAFVDVKYNASRVRARFVPGFGTYLNANYLNEEGSLKNLVEASVGVRPFANKNIWIDAGVIGSPYTNESAISKDHLAFTRSLAPEYVPYYLSGIKTSMPINDKFNFNFYLLNGWQEISERSKGKAIGTQIEYRPNNKWLLNWNTYTGHERSEVNPDWSYRFFTDFYFIYVNNDFSITSCAYIGWQQRDNLQTANWWQINAIARYRLTDKHAVSYRIEYFKDEDEMVAQSITSTLGFKTFSASAGWDYQIANNLLWRTEIRNYTSTDKVFTKESNLVKQEWMVTTGLTVWY